MTIEKYGKRYLVEKPFVGLVGPLAKKYFDRFINVEKIGELPDGPSVCVFNHDINFNGLVNIANIPKLHFVIQREGVYNSALKPWIWASGNIPVSVKAEDEEGRECNKRAFLRCGEYLEFGDRIGVFSEGPASRLIKDGNVVPVEARRHYPIAAQIALLYRVPIIPVGLYSVNELSKRLWESPGFFENKKVVSEYNREFAEELNNPNFKMPYVISVGPPILVGNYDGCTPRNIIRLNSDVKTQLLKEVDRAKQCSLEKRMLR